VLSKFSVISFSD